MRMVCVIAIQDLTAHRVNHAETVTMVRSAYIVQMNYIAVVMASAVRLERGSGVNVQICTQGMIAVNLSMAHRVFKTPNVTVMCVLRNAAKMQSKRVRDTVCATYTGAATVSLDFQGSHVIKKIQVLFA